MLQNQKIVMIGGSSGIGYETAKKMIEQGAEVIIASRSEAKLRKAVEQLGPKAEAHVLNTVHEKEVKAFFAKIGRFHHLVVTAAVTSGGPFLHTDTAQARELFENKFWGQYYAVKYGAPNIESGGSITLFSGVAGYKSMIGSSTLGAVNAAVSALAQSLALELALIRVNTVSPGIIDTPSRSHLSTEAREAFYAGIAGKLPLKRVGTADDVAQSVLYLIQNGFVTGTVLHVEGGHMLS
ncbi:SDR family oxidoreductase [Paenibacillus donghaensis]|uniref:SDR family oxidoreductase n=1 Tax=Paenibacillus donghaensis TaxID=414771 RepID=UPI00188470B9|nr:SDR family oxidoreductase [Paenibacillus donghaensis]MBE9914817.1 SDR family oxidoreductase [Paenibacillus donghaensis]